MRVTVFGSGLAAQVVSVALADTGNQVNLVPMDEEESTRLKQGRSSRSESRLAGLLSRQVSTGVLKVIDDPKIATKNSNIVILALASVRLKEAQAIVKTVAKHMENEIDFINMSAFPVGSSDHFESMIMATLLAEQKEISFSVSVIPEFISEGVRALDDFIRPDRIVLGVSDKSTKIRLMQLLRPFNRRENVVKVISRRGAEYVKLAMNTFLAARISLMNELANNAEHFGIDIEEVRQGIGSDRRIGFDYLYPGTGFGGGNFAKEMQDLLQMLIEHGGDASLVESIIQMNETQKEVLFRKLWRFYQGDLTGKTVALWGIAFKPETPVITNAPGVVVLEALLAQGVTVKLHDPMALESVKAAYPDETQIIYCDDAYEATKNADALLVLTEWKAYWNPDFECLKQNLNTPLIIDGRNIFDPALLKTLGFKYMGVGRGENML